MVRRTCRLSRLGDALSIEYLFISMDGDVLSRPRFGAMMLPSNLRERAADAYIFCRSTHRACADRPGR